MTIDRQDDDAADQSYLDALREQGIIDSGGATAGATSDAQVSSKDQLGPDNIESLPDDLSDLGREFAEQRHKEAEADLQRSEAARLGTLIGGLTDSRQYTNMLRRFLQGAPQFAGSSLQTPDVIASGAELQHRNLMRGQLDLYDRIDRGQSLMEDPAYAQASAEERQRMRDNLNKRLAMPLRGVEDRPLYQLGKSWRDWADAGMPEVATGIGLAPDALKVDPGYEDSVGANIGSGLASVAMGALPAKFLGMMPTGAFYISLGVSEALDRALKYDKEERAAGREGLTPEQIFIASILGAGPGFTDLAPIEMLFDRLPYPVPAPLKRALSKGVARIGGAKFLEALGRIGAQTAVESGQEGFQQFLQNLISQQTYDAKQGLDEDVLKSMGFGGAVGGIAETAKELGGGLMRLRGRGRSTAPGQSDTKPAEPAPETGTEPATAPDLSPQGGEGNIAPLPDAAGPVVPPIGQRPDEKLDILLQPPLEAPLQQTQPDDATDYEAPIDDLVPEQGAGMLQDELDQQAARTAGQPTGREVEQDEEPLDPDLERAFTEQVHGVYEERGEQMDLPPDEVRQVVRIMHDDMVDAAEALDIYGQRKIDEDWQAQPLSERLATVRAEQAPLAPADIDAAVPEVHDGLWRMAQEQGLVWEHNDEDVRAIAAHMARGLSIEEALEQHAAETHEKIRTARGAPESITGSAGRASDYAAQTVGEPGQITGLSGAADAGGPLDPILTGAGPSPARVGHDTATAAGQPAGAPADGAGLSPVGGAVVGPGGEAIPAGAGLAQRLPGAAAGRPQSQRQRAAELDSKFADILNGTAPYWEWQETLGASPSEMAGLLDAAIRRGQITLDIDGNVIRTPLATRAPARPSIAQASLPFKPDPMTTGQVAAYEARVGRSVSPTTRLLADEAQRLRGRAAFEVFLEREDVAKLPLEDAIDLANIAGYPVALDVTRAAAMKSLRRRHQDHRAYLERNAPDLLANDVDEAYLASFAGEQAATADLAALAQAQAMEKSGASSRDIWAKTGWFKRGDGKWRFEIDDSKVAFSEGEVVFDSRTVDSDRQILAMHLLDADMDKDGARLSIKRRIDDLRGRSLELTLRGESADALQPLITGYVRLLGELERAQVRRGLRKSQNAASGETIYVYRGPLGDLIDAPQLFAAYPSLRTTPVTIGAASDLLSAASFNPRTRAIGVSAHGNKDLLMSSLLHEIQHAIQLVEGFAMGGNDGTLLARTEVALFEITQQILGLPENSNVRAELEDMRTTLKLQAQEFGGGFSGLAATAMGVDSYVRILGEVEARNTQWRMRMPQAVRDDSFPLETEDVPQTEQYAPGDLVRLRTQHADTINALMDEEYPKLPSMVEPRNRILRSPKRHHYYSVGLGDIDGKRGNFMEILSFTKKDITKRLNEYGIDAVRNVLIGLVNDGHAKLARGDKWWPQDRIDATLAVIGMLDRMRAAHPELGPRPQYVVNRVDPAGLIEPYQGRTFTEQDVSDLKKKIGHQIARLEGQLVEIDVLDENDEPIGTEMVTIDSDAVDALLYDFDAQGFGHEHGIDQVYPGAFALLKQRAGQLLADYQLANEYLLYMAQRRSLRIAEAFSVGALGTPADRLAARMRQMRIAQEQSFVPWHDGLVGALRQRMHRARKMLLRGDVDGPRRRAIEAIERDLAARIERRKTQMPASPVAEGDTVGAVTDEVDARLRNMAGDIEDAVGLLAIDRVLDDKLGQVGEADALLAIGDGIEDGVAQRKALAEWRPSWRDWLVAKYLNWRKKGGEHNAVIGEHLSDDEMRQHEGKRLAKFAKAGFDGIINAGEFAIKGDMFSVALANDRGAREDRLRLISDEDGMTLMALGKSQRALDVLGFYSAAIEAARGLKQGKGTPEQMLRMLENSPGVKKAELEATGFYEWIKAKSSAAAPSEIVTPASEQVAYADLPYDLKVLIQQYAETDAGEHGAVPSRLPVRTVAVRDLPAIPLDPFDRGEAHAREMDLRQTPPILIANGYFLDGKHRIFRARELGVEALPAIDLTGIANPRNMRMSDDLKLQGRGDRTAGAASPKPALNQITKQDIISFLESHKIEVREAQYVGSANSRTGWIEMQRQHDADEFIREHEVYQGPNGYWHVRGVARGWASRMGAEGHLDQMARDHVYSVPDSDYLSRQGSPYAANLPVGKWSSYSIDPSNPSYRETVLHLAPPRELWDRLKVVLTEMNAIERAPRTPTNQLSDESRWLQLSKERDALNARIESGQFKSGHFSEPNIIVHFRTSLQMDAKGNLVFVVDELQSDWGQKLRDGGVRDEKKIAELRKAIDDAYQVRVGLAQQAHALVTEAGLTHGGKGSQFMRTNGEIDIPAVHTAMDWLQDSEKYGFPIAKRAHELEQRMTAALQAEKLKEAEWRTAKAATPGHPMVNTTDRWVSLALKRIISQAIAAGATKIAITPGAVQVERFNLANHVSGLRYDPDKHYLQMSPGERSGMGFPGRWYDLSGSPKVAPEQLADYVGKETAKAILAAPREDGWHTLDKIDADIGGHGMRAAYDNIYPTALGKLLASYDKSIKRGSEGLFSSVDGRPFLAPADSEGAREFADGVHPNEAIRRVIADRGLTPDEAKSVIAQIKAAPSIQFHTFPITPALIDAVGMGQSLFALGTGDNPADFRGQQPPYRLNGGKLSLKEREQRATAIMSSPEWAAREEKPKATPVGPGVAGGDQPSMLNTANQPGFMTDAWKAQRSYVDPETGNAIQGYDNLIKLMAERAIAAAVPQFSMREAVKERRAFLIIGYPGSGKSTAAAPLRDIANAVHVVSDHARPYIREWNGGQNNGGVQKEVAKIAGDVVTAVVAAGHNITIETLGTVNGVAERSAYLRNNGYHITLIHVDTPKAVAMERAIARREEEGRGVLLDSYTRLNAGDVYAHAKREGLVDEGQIVRWNEDRERFEIAEAAQGLARFGDEFLRGMAGRGGDRGVRRNEPQAGSRPLAPADLDRNGFPRGRGKDYLFASGNRPDFPRRGWASPMADWEEAVERHFWLERRNGNPLAGRLTLPTIIAGQAFLDAATVAAAAGEPTVENIMGAMLALYGTYVLAREHVVDIVRIRDKLKAVNPRRAPPAPTRPVPNANAIALINGDRAGLRTALEVMVPADVAVRIVDALRTADGLGMYAAYHLSGRIIELAQRLDGRSVLGRVQAIKGFHEVVHALREWGRDDGRGVYGVLFTDKEWATLLERAKKIDIDSKMVFADGTSQIPVYRKLYRSMLQRSGFQGDIEARIEELIDQERVAKLAEAWANETNFGKTVNTLIERIINFIQAFNNWLAGNGFNTYHDVFGRVTSGEIARRAGTPSPHRLRIERSNAERALRSASGDAAINAMRRAAAEERFLRQQSGDDALGSLSDVYHNLRGRLWSTLRNEPDEVRQYPEEAERQLKLFEEHIPDSESFRRQHGIMRIRGDGIERQAASVARYLDTYHANFPTVASQWNMRPLHPVATLRELWRERLGALLRRAPTNAEIDAIIADFKDGDLKEWSAGVDADVVRRWVASNPELTSVPDEEAWKVFRNDWMAERGREPFVSRDAFLRMRGEKLGAIGPDAGAASPDLGMSPEVRKARAEAVGFDTSTVWYHGTPYGGFGAFTVSALVAQASDEGVVDLGEYARLLEDGSPEARRAIALGPLRPRLNAMQQALEAGDIAAANRLHQEIVDRGGDPSDIDVASALPAAIVRDFRPVGNARGQVREEIDPSSGLRVRTYAIATDDGARSSIVAGELANGTWEVAFLDAHPAHQDRLADHLEEMTVDLPGELAPSGFLTQEAYAYWMRVNPARIQFHVRTGALFDNLYVSPQAARLSLAVLQAADGEGSADRQAYRAMLRTDLEGILARTPPEAFRISDAIEKFTVDEDALGAIDTHHGSPNDWAAERKVRLANGDIAYLPAAAPLPAGAEVLQELPFGRPRFDKTRPGAHQAFGPGFYSAESRKVSETYLNVDDIIADITLDGEPLTAEANNRRSASKYASLQAEIDAIDYDPERHAELREIADSIINRNRVRSSTSRPATGAELRTATAGSTSKTYYRGAYPVYRGSGVTDNWAGRAQWRRQADGSTVITFDRRRAGISKRSRNLAYLGDSITVDASGKITSTNSIRFQRDVGTDLPDLIGNRYATTILQGRPKGKIDAVITLTPGSTYGSPSPKYEAALLLEHHGDRAKAIASLRKSIDRYEKDLAEMPAWRLDLRHDRAWVAQKLSDWRQQIKVLEAGTEEKGIAFSDLVAELEDLDAKHARIMDIADRKDRLVSEVNDDRFKSQWLREAWDELSSYASLEAFERDAGDARAYADDSKLSFEELNSDSGDTEYAIAAAIRELRELQASGRLKWRRVQPSEGGIYHLTLHVEPDDLLQWDEPLSRQPKGVQEKLKIVFGDNYQIDSKDRPKPLDRLWLRLTGRAPLIQPGRVRRSGRGAATVKGLLGSVSDQEALRLALAKAGIPGIRFLDGFSRLKGEGTHNYVIFDADKHVEVTGKNGVPVSDAIKQKVIAADQDALAALGDRPPRDLDDAGYYSEALERAKAWKQTRGSPEQIRALLKDVRRETDAIGLEDWLNSRVKPVVISKDELVDFLSEARMRMEENTFINVQRMTSDEVDESREEALERARESEFDYYLGEIEIVEAFSDEAYERAYEEAAEAFALRRLEEGDRDFDPEEPRWAVFERGWVGMSPTFDRMGSTFHDNYDDAMEEMDEAIRDSLDSDAGKVYRLRVFGDTQDYDYNSYSRAETGRNEEAQYYVDDLSDDELLDRIGWVEPDADDDAGDDVPADRLVSGRATWGDYTASTSNGPEGKKNPTYAERIVRLVPSELRAVMLNVADGNTDPQELDLLHEREKALRSQLFTGSHSFGNKQWENITGHYQRTINMTPLMLPPDGQFDQGMLPGLERQLKALMLHQIQSDWSQKLRDARRDAWANKLFGPETEYGKQKLAEAQAAHDAAMADKVAVMQRVHAFAKVHMPHSAIVEQGEEISDRGARDYLDSFVYGERGRATDVPTKYGIPEVWRVRERSRSRNDFYLNLKNDGDAYRALMERFPELNDNESWEEVVVDSFYVNNPAADEAQALSNAIDAAAAKEMQTAATIRALEHPASFRELTPEQKKEVAKAIQAESNAGGRRHEGTLDVAKIRRLEGEIAELRERIKLLDERALVVLKRYEAAGDAEFRAIVEGVSQRRMGSGSAAHMLSPSFRYAVATERTPGFLEDVERKQIVDEFNVVNAQIGIKTNELQVARAALPSHPLVDTTTQWLETTLRRVIRDAVDNGTDIITLPPGGFVLSYNPGGDHGMREFYDVIAARALLKELRKHDPAVKPFQVRLLNGAQREVFADQDGKDVQFNAFPITDRIRAAFAPEMGMRLMAIGDGPAGGGAMPSVPYNAPKPGQVRGVAEIINDLKKQLGLPATIGRYKMKISDVRAGRSWSLNPMARGRGPGGQYALGAARLRVGTDIDAIAKAGGEHILARMRGVMQPFLLAHAEELTEQPAANGPLPPLNPNGFSGMELDDDTQAALVASAQLYRRWQALSTAPGSGRDAVRKAGLDAAVAVRKLSRRLGQTTAYALLDDLVGNPAKPGGGVIGASRDRLISHGPTGPVESGIDPAAVPNYVRMRYSASGTPRPRSVPSPSQVELEAGFVKFFERLIAEAERYTAHDPVRRDQPGTYDAFRELMSAHNPQLLENINGIRTFTASEQYLTYRRATAWERGVADSGSMREPSAWQRILNFFGSSNKIDRFNQWFSHIGSMLSYSTLDKTNPILKIVQGLLNIADREGLRDVNGRPLSLNTWGNAHKIARMMAGAHGIGHQWIVEGVPDYNGVEPQGPSLRSALVTALGGGGRAQWNDQAIARFGVYLEARRAAAEWPRFLAGEIGQPTRRSLEENQAIIRDAETANPQYRAAAQMVYDWQHRLLTLEYEAGKWTTDAFRALTARKDFYVPYRRMIDEEAWGGSGDYGRIASRFTGSKRFKGHDSDIINPIESMVQRAYHAAAAIQFNDMVKAMATLSDRIGPAAAKLVERIDQRSSMIANASTFERLKQQAIKLGVDPADAHLILMDAQQNFTDAEVQVLFEPTDFGPKRPPMLPLWENGERRLVRFNDPVMGRRVFDAMNGIGRPFSNQFLGVLTSIFSKPASILRAGVTMHPAFVLSNIVGDMMGAWARTGALPVITQMRGLHHLLSTNPAYASALRSLGLKPSDISRIYTQVGGISGGQNVAALNAVSRNYELTELRRDGFRPWDARAVGGLGAVMAGGFLGGVVAGPIGATIGAGAGALASRLVLGKGAEVVFAQLSELSETVTRLGVAAKVAKRAKALDPSISDVDAIREAAFTARNVLDFDRGGAHIGPLLKLVPFLNSNLQGVSAMYRQALMLDGERGRVNMDKMRLFLRHMLTRTAASRAELSAAVSVEDEKALRDGARLWVNMALMAFVSLALAFAYRDDKDIEDVPDDIKYTHWIVRVPVLGLLRIKKPFEMAALANIAEAVYDRVAKDDPRLLKRLKDGVLSTHMPPLVPAIGGIAIGWRTGIDPRTGRPIEPETARGRSAELRYGAYSSAFAREWAKALAGVGLHVSPSMIDWTLQAEFAYWGREVKATSDYFWGHRGAPKFTDLPILGTIANRFAVDPSRASQSVKEFWDLMGTGRGDYARAAADYDHYLSEANPLATTSYLASLPRDERIYAVLQKHFTPRDKEAHPLNRAGIVVRINAAMRREMAEAGGLISTAGGSSRGRGIAMTADQQRTVDDVLGRLSAIEAWNSLHLIGRDGWEARQVRDPQPLLDELRAASPEAYAEMMRRRRDKKVGTFEADRARWLDVQGKVDRLISDQNLLGAKWRQSFRRRRGPARRMEESGIAPKTTETPTAEPAQDDMGQQ